MTIPGDELLDRQLQAIFHPYAVRQMQDFFNKQPDQTARFVHYTSAEAALRIIEKKRIWMRNVTCMSDYSEVQHGFRILDGVFLSNRFHRSAFNEALDACAPGAAEEAIALFKSWWADISLNSYITCLSEHDDKEDKNGRLSMWRAFGEHLVGIAIVLKVSSSLLNAGVFNLVVSPVAYLPKEDVEREFKRVLANITGECAFLKSVSRQRIIASVFNMLVAGVTCLKHDGFREEREWRLVYAPNRWSSPLIESSTEVVRGIPQIVHKIPFDASVTGVPNFLDFSSIFDRLIIGPSQYPWSMAQAFKTALGKAGVSEARSLVVFSEIPIRTPG